MRINDKLTPKWHKIDAEHTQVLTPNILKQIDVKLVKICHIIFCHNRPVKDEQKWAISEEGQKKRWREHFKKLLNREAPQNPPNISPAETDLQIDCGEPLKEDILNVIKQLNNKSAGPDSISPETLKADSKTTADILQLLFKKIWEEEQVPKQWKEGYLVKFQKKATMIHVITGELHFSPYHKVFNRVGLYC